MRGLHYPEPKSESGSAQVLSSIFAVNRNKTKAIKTTLLGLAFVCALGATFLASPQLQRGLRGVSGGMGMVFGKIDVEQPAFNVDLKNKDYQIRRYGICWRSK